MDKLIIGAGLYGLYAALYCAKKGQQVEVLEIEQAPFTRATYINQARVHMGYHYPRSLSTAMKSAGYFKRFVEDYSFCIHTSFEQIYATSAHFSWTDAAEFLKFCKDGGIPCKALPVEEYFQPGLCDGAFLTEEYTYDTTPKFPCVGQDGNICRNGWLGNCNDCPGRPESAWEYMSTLARKYLREEYGFSYEKSLFSMKPILKASEIDDSRPTVIRAISTEPTLISVLSGKINTVYDLDPFLE